MKRIALVLALAPVSTLLLPACNLTSVSSVSALPPPLAQTEADDRLLAASFASFDALLTAIDVMLDAGLITPGSERANSIADHLAKARDLLNRASVIQRAGEGDPSALLAEAATALSVVRSKL